MKRLILTFAFLLCFVMMQGQNTDLKIFAHRGCWSKTAEGVFVIPENSPAAVKEARKNGYLGIECDVRYTKDKKMVVLHDSKLNRTARRSSDYSKLEKSVRLSDLTFDELRRDYVLESTDPSLRTPVPTLEEILLECRKQGMMPMLHSSVEESYELAQEMFGDKWICFTTSYDNLLKVRKFSNCTILLSIKSESADEVVEKLQMIGGRCGISSMNYNLYTEAFCKTITDAGYEVQASIFPVEEEAKALQNGITYILTDHRLYTKKEKRRLR